jgi:hypothetical protein
MRRLGIVIAAAALCQATSAQAVTDGTLGTTSTGTVDLQVATGSLVLVTGFADIDLGVWPGAGDLNANQAVCVYANNGGGDYQVTATSARSFAAGRGFFSMENGTGDVLTYAVGWADAPAAGAPAGVAATDALTQNNLSGNLDFADQTSQTCATGGNTGRYFIGVLGVDLGAAPAGVYTDTLTFLLNPN